MPSISYSRASLYEKCPQAHYFSYVERLQARAPARPLSFGSDFHKLLEHRGNKEKLAEIMKDIEEKYYELDPNYQQILGENYVADLKSIFNDYNKMWKTAEVPTETELEFNLPIGNYKGEPVTFKGIIDEIYRLEDLVVIGEHKTFSQAPKMEILVMNRQACLYAKAVEMLTGTMPDKVRWDYIKSTPASEPLWLEKSARFSNAASTTITPFSWKRACKRRNIEDKAVLFKGKDYTPNLSNFFFRCDLEVVPTMVNQIWDDFKQTAKEIMIKGETNKRKTVTRDCSWCNYRPICFTEFTNGDVNYVKSKDFEHKEREEINVDETTS